MGATFSDIGELIDGVVDKELKDIVIVGGSRAAMESANCENNGRTESAPSQGENGDMPSHRE